MSPPSFPPAVHVHPPHPDDGPEDAHWTVSGDLRAPGSGWSDEANYDCRDDLRPVMPDVQFDPESSCFFAYVETQTAALRLVAAIEAWVAARRSLDPVAQPTTAHDWDQFTPEQLDELDIALRQRLDTLGLGLIGHHDHDADVNRRGEIVTALLNEVRSARRVNSIRVEGIES